MTEEDLIMMAHDIQAALARLPGSIPTSKPVVMAALTDFVTTSSFQVPYGTPRILSILRVFRYRPTSPMPSLTSGWENIDSAATCPRTWKLARIASGPSCFIAPCASERQDSVRSVSISLATVLFISSRRASETVDSDLIAGCKDRVVKIHFTRDVLSESLVDLTRSHFKTRLSTSKAQARWKKPP
jgi:hypothetical protein